MVVASCAAFQLTAACGSSDSPSPATAAGGSSGTPGTGGSPGNGGASASGGSSANGGSTGKGGASGGSGSGNNYSWDGSWNPSDNEFPLPGLLDDFYFDGHPDEQNNPTPILPPGKWDWSDTNHDLANWRNFEKSIGSFEALVDAKGHQYGWKLIPVSPGAVDYSGPADYFEGSSGIDVLVIGANGTIGSFGNGNLGDGPDVLVFGKSHTLDFRTGASSRGSAHDNDLVVAGCGQNADGSFDVTTTTIHTGPGADRVFLRDVDRSAIDLGNGADGRTDTVDSNDGDDMVVLRGNTHDFRVFGGNGNDTFVWYPDDNVQTSAWLGPNFFGGGGWDSAVWQDSGVDRLVLAIPAEAPIVSATPTPNGSVLVRATDGSLKDDPPTASDPYAHYCAECGTGPGGRKTVIVEYNSASGAVKTGYFTITAIEELQIGVGAGARVYKVDDVTGAATLDSSAVPTTPPAWPDGDCP